MPPLQEFPLELARSVLSPPTLAVLLLSGLIIWQDMVERAGYSLYVLLLAAAFPLMAMMADRPVDLTAHVKTALFTTMMIIPLLLARIAATDDAILAAAFALWLGPAMFGAFLAGGVIGCAAFWMVGRMRQPVEGPAPAAAQPERRRFGTAISLVGALAWTIQPAFLWSSFGGG